MKRTNTMKTVKGESPSDWMGGRGCIYRGGIDLVCLAVIVLFGTTLVVWCCVVSNFVTS